MTRGALMLAAGIAVGGDRCGFGVVSDVRAVRPGRHEADQAGVHFVEELWARVEHRRMRCREDGSLSTCAVRLDPRQHERIGDGLGMRIVNGTTAAARPSFVLPTSTHG